MNYIITKEKIAIEKLAFYFTDFEQKVIGNIYLYYDTSCDIIENEDAIAIFSGYIYDSEKTEKLSLQKSQILKEIENVWPLAESMSGSYAVVIFNKQKKTISICNDCIGIYPLYYSVSGDFISSSLILSSITNKQGVDEVGIVERAYSRENSNFGSRTILNSIKRLLPGEKIIFNQDGIITSRAYDNTLYNNIGTSVKPSKIELDKYFYYYKREVEAILADTNEAYIALSGGMDSRILFGAAANKDNLKCLTYGPSDSYETKVARRLSKKLNKDFNSFENNDLYFPNKKIFERNTLRTEATVMTSWLQILDTQKINRKQTLLLGDMCEALPGRNIKKFKSRKSRIETFFSTYILGQPYEFVKNSPAGFEKWKKQVMDHQLKPFTDKAFQHLNFNHTQKEIRDGIVQDLEELFKRIESHNLPYLELLDELFEWYTHSRIPMGKQILICNHHFNALCPPMSSGILRNTSNIHPNQRLNYRFMDALFKREKILKKLNSVPTYQSPLLPRKFPAPLIYLVWGIRSKVDNFLIRRMIKKKNPALRYRLFKNINHAQIYQDPSLKEKMDAYFENNFLGKGFESDINARVFKRKNLESWPYVNTDIISCAGLNIELELIDIIKNK